MPYGPGSRSPPPTRMHIPPEPPLVLMHGRCLYIYLKDKGRTNKHGVMFVASCHVLLPRSHSPAPNSPGMWLPSYLIPIWCRPFSVGAYRTVMVPSLLSVMLGRAVLPEGIRTSPERQTHMQDSGFSYYMPWLSQGLLLCGSASSLPVSSPFCTVKGMTKLKGLSIDSSGSTGTTGSSVACSG